jgi:hypothetical protein
MNEAIEPIVSHKNGRGDHVKKALVHTLREPNNASTFRPILERRGKAHWSFSNCNEIERAVASAAMARPNVNCTASEQHLKQIVSVDRMILR